MPMRICGISFDSSVAIIVIADFDLEGQCRIVEAETKRVDLLNHEDDACLKNFHRLITALVNDHDIDRIAIRKCTYSGKYQSGASSLKMEAILQLAEVPTELLAPKTVNKVCEKNECEIPEELNKYQHDAFRAAFALASNGPRVQ
jgi:hypothetical protein